jgi:hypothetical protein
VFSGQLASFWPEVLMREIDWGWISSTKPVPDPVSARPFGPFESAAIATAIGHGDPVQGTAAARAAGAIIQDAAAATVSPKSAVRGFHPILMRRQHTTGT